MGKMKQIMRFFAVFLTLVMLLPCTIYAEEGTEITDVDIENVWFNYQPGDVPKASATKQDPFCDMYDIEYEYWECMEQTEQGLEPTAFWYSDESKNNALAADKRLTSFEEGKSYMYSISLKAKDGINSHRIVL